MAQNICYYLAKIKLQILNLEFIYWPGYVE